MGERLRSLRTEKAVSAVSKSQDIQTGGRVGSGTSLEPRPRSMCPEGTERAQGPALYRPFPTWDAEQPVEPFYSLDHLRKVLAGYETLAGSLSPNHTGLGCYTVLVYLNRERVSRLLSLSRYHHSIITAITANRIIPIIRVLKLNSWDSSTFSDRGNSRRTFNCVFSL